MKIRYLIAALAFAPAALMAVERNDVPSCYEITKLTEFKAPSSGRLLTVIVDQTTPLNLSSFGGNPPRFNEELDAVVRVHPVRRDLTISRCFRLLPVRPFVDEWILPRVSRASRCPQGIPRRIGVLA